MKFGFVIPYASANEFLELSVEIEQAGWDAAFGWETIYGIDPWVVLGGMAALTERIKLGTLLTPPSRRRPWKLASELVTLDMISNGRALLCAGLGALDTGFAQVGEETDRKKRAELMDECSGAAGTVLDRANRSSFMAPTTTSTGRHPWARSSRCSNRAFRSGMSGSWEARPRCGAPRAGTASCPTRAMPKATGPLPVPMSCRRSEQSWRARGADLDTFDIAVEGLTPAGDEAALDNVRGLAENGATWWIESMWKVPGGIPAVRERIAAGPPQL